MNLAEVLGRFVLLGADADALNDRIAASGLEIHALDRAAARQIARLLPVCRSRGLSLGDRACLALGQQLRLPVRTGDRAGIDLPLDVRVELIR